MDQLKYWLTKGNVATAIVAILAVVGLEEVVAGDLTFDQLINLMDIPVGGLLIGAGFAAIKFSKALPGEQLISPLTLVMVVVALGTGIQAVFGDLTYEGMLQTLDVPIAALALGRGAAANNGPPA